MIKVGDIFEDARVKTRPFDIPEGYVDGLEKRVSEGISGQQQRGSAWGVLKPAALLVCAFAFVLAMGYGMMALTGTKSSHRTLAKAPVTEEIIIEDDEIVDYLAQTLTLEDISEILSSGQTTQNQQ